jgi:hypothetical protein
VLKEGPVMRRFINRHRGVPEPVADVVTTNIAKSLRSYFLAVTIIAAFNAILIGGAALILGVPLAGTIAVVTFVGAYRRWIARRRHLLRDGRLGGRHARFSLMALGRLAHFPRSAIRLIAMVGIGSAHHFSLQNRNFEIGLPPNFPRSVGNTRAISP